jgi:hypothetical protein
VKFLVGFVFDADDELPHLIFFLDIENSLFYIRTELVLTTCKLPAILSISCLCRREASKQKSIEE